MSLDETKPPVAPEVKTPPAPATPKPPVVEKKRTAKLAELEAALKRK